jgi:hypothetical protein
MKLLLITFIFISTLSYSQDTTKYIGGVSITMDQKIDSLIKLRTLKRKYWRVQMDFSTEKKDLTATKEKFLKYHPDMEAKIYFDAPYWKLKVGEFETKQEAEDFIDTIRKYYKDKGLFPVREENEHIRKESTK